MSERHNITHSVHNLGLARAGRGRFLRQGFGEDFVGTGQLSGLFGGLIELGCPLPCLGGQEQCQLGRGDLAGIGASFPIVAGIVAAVGGLLIAGEFLLGVLGELALFGIVEIEIAHCLILS